MKSVLKLFIRILFGIFYRVEITGRENVPKSGAALLCANHLGEMDMFFIGYRIKRLVRWVAKQELFKNPIMSAFITWLGAVPIKRGAGDVGAIKVIFKLIDEGHVVGMYPEGTRAKNRIDSESKIKPGAAMIAIKKGIPILPVAMEGKQKIFSKIRIVFGKPFYLKVEEGRKYNNEEMTEMSEDIMRKVYALLEEK
jgi:1-acyl-sn-glycerol-3-phosphate acyltransferase